MSITFNFSEFCVCVLPLRLTLVAPKLGVPLSICSWSNFSSPAKCNFQVGIHLTSPEALACLIVIHVLPSCAAGLSARCGGGQNVYNLQTRSYMAVFAPQNSSVCFLGNKKAQILKIYIFSTMNCIALGFHQLVYTAE